MIKDKNQRVGLENIKRRIKISDEGITERDNKMDDNKWCVQKEVRDDFFHFYYCEKEVRKESKGACILIFLCGP